MSKILSPVLLGIGFIMVFLLYQNRSSPKIWEATIVSFGVIIVALLFVTNDQPIKKLITPVYFMTKEDNSFLFFIDKPVLSQHYMRRGAMFGGYEHRLSESEEKSDLDFFENKKSIVDMQVMAVIEHLFLHYKRAWYVKTETLELPGATFFYGGGELDNKESVKNDIATYTKDSMPTSLKKNMFFDDIISFSGGLALPKNTRIQYTQEGGPFWASEIRLYKPFNFDIRIEMTYRAQMFGLGNVGHYIGMTDPEREFIETNDPAFQNYKNIGLRMKCTAKFPWYRTWNPSVLIYKTWANVLFDELYQEFDWFVWEDKIKSHQQAVANQKIINK